MVFAIWDLESKNLVGDYESEQEALSVVEKTLAVYGRDSVLTLALESEDETGEIGLLAEGEGLIALVLERKPFAQTV